MSLKIETILLSLEADQYAGKGQATPGIADYAKAAREMEALGFDHLTTAEAGHDPYLPIVIAAEHTDRVKLATNVAIAFPRSPMVTAQVAWDLQHLSHGRFQLGIGTQVKGHNERRYAAPWTAPPGPRLRDYVQCLRAMFASFQTGTTTRFEGEHYQFTMLPPFFNPGPIEYPAPPIHIAAVNKYMTRLCGELCDGLRLHPISTLKYTKEVILPAVAAGAAKAGRSLADIEIIGAPFLAIAPDEAGVEKAKAETRQRIAFYASTRTYHSVLEFHGWNDVGARLHQYSLEGKWTEMPALITDEMLAEFALIGTYDQLAAQIAERCPAAFTTVMLDMPADLRRDRDRVKDIVRDIRQSH
jgi:probable F420-dependent oxidoreductase